MRSEGAAARAARGRGRPQRLPTDPHPATEAAIDPIARLAWLLATWRVLSPVTAQLTREEFVEQMRGEGVVLDRTRVSRWESGSVAPRLEVIDAYEGVLGIPEGSLRSLRVLMGGAAQDVPAPLPADAAADLDDSLEQVGRRRATGADWLRLAQQLTAYERVYLEPATWQRLTSRLITELTRSSGVAFLRRHIAAVQLLGHPSASRHLSLGVGRFVMNPDVQSVQPALALLREVGEAAVSDLVLRLVGNDNRLLRRAALGVVPGMASRGHFPDDIAPLLEHQAILELRKGGAPARRVDAFDLVTHLSPDALTRLLAAVDDAKTRSRISLVHTSRELMKADTARLTADHVAVAVETAVGRASHDPDQMLRKLIREALFHARTERRAMAAILLASSAYATPLSSALLDLTRRDELTAAMSWAALRRFGHVLDRDTVAEVALAEQRPALQARAWIALGLARGPLHDDVADELVAQATSGDAYGQQHSTVYALGMSGHPRLRDLAAYDDPALSRAARWWLDVGGALHDELA